MVSAGNPANWKYPPFAGTVADGRIWGRGANDCKIVIMAHMETLEILIADGLVPDFDVYLGYGYNEEVSDIEGNSAAKICKTLQGRGVRLGLVIDEGADVGPGSADGLQGLVGYIKIAEKGYADFKISIRDKSGHSMAPGKRSIVAELGQIAVDLHNNQFPYRLIDCIREEYSIKARHLIRGSQLCENIEENFEEACP